MHRLSQLFYPFGYGRACAQYEAYEIILLLRIKLRKYAVRVSGVFSQRLNEAPWSG